jgi:hypothetical protein
MGFQRDASGVCFKTGGGKTGKIVRQNANFANGFTMLRLFKGFG